MAQRVVLVDDLSGAPIKDGRGGTVVFSVDGADYEIDLTASNIGRLHLALAPFTNAARPQGGVQARTRVTAVRATAGRLTPEMSAAIRHWAKRVGYEVPRAGRIPSGILAAFDTAH